MAMPLIPCPRCQGEMQPGFLLDSTYGALLQCRWVQGAPEECTVFGIHTGSLDVDVSRQRRVDAYRCEKCGYLELYAPDPNDSSQILLRPAQAGSESDSRQLLRASQSDAPEDEPSDS